MNGLFEVIWNSNVKGRPRQSMTIHQETLDVFMWLYVFHYIMKTYMSNKYVHRPFVEFHEV